MSESSLSIGYPELCIEVGYAIGYGRTAASWSTAQLSLIDSIVQSGVRRVYFPPSVGEIFAGYEWSWLRPTTTIAIESGTADYDFPDDFGRLSSPLYYPSEEYRRPVQLVSLGKILSRRSFSDLTGAPTECATRYKACDGTVGSRQELLLFPEPDDDWTMKYEYEAFTGALTDAAPYALGGMKMAEVYIESCLAVAETRMDIDDKIGIHTTLFKALLVDAIQRDKKTGAVHFGQMSGGDSEVSEFHRGYGSGTYPITYDGETI